MELIHKPRMYTNMQNRLMSAVVAYIWGPERTDVVVATNEITENIAILEDVAPSDLDALSQESKQALINYGKVKLGVLEEVRRQAKGFELLAIWLNAVYDYA